MEPRYDKNGSLNLFDNGNMAVFLRLDSFHEVSTFKHKTLLGTFGEIGGLFSFLQYPLVVITGYITGVSFEAKIIQKLFF